MNKPTPGPWMRKGKTTITGRYVIPPGMPAVAGGYPLVCELEDQPDLEANAGLIKAAPDLLAACELVLALDSDDFDVPPELKDKMRSAIAKAKGEA